MGNYYTKEILLVAVVLTGLTGCDYIGPNSDSVQGDASSSANSSTLNSGLRFDGIYESTNSDVPDKRMYLRFYEDGTVLYLRSQENMASIENSFNRSVYCTNCRSTYAPGIPIIFETLREGGGVIIQNQGRIENDELVIDSYVKYDNTRNGPFRFSFTPVVFESRNTLPTKPVKEPTVEGRSPINDEWDLYTNNDMGFSLKLPNFVEATYEQKTNTVEISQPDSYGWTIMMTSVNELQDLEKTIQSISGPDCVIKKISTVNNGNYDWVQVGTKQGSDLPNGEHSCKATQSAWRFFFSPNQKKLIYWDAGQEQHFNTTGKAYDGEMVTGFSFVN